MSITRLFIEKEIDLIDQKINKANNEIREAQSFINEQNKLLQALEERKTAFQSDLGKLAE